LSKANHLKVGIVRRNGAAILLATTILHEIASLCSQWRYGL